MFCRVLVQLIALSLWSLPFGPLPALAEPLELIIDADYSKNPASSQSIELGVRTALEEVDYMLGDLPVVVVPKDHRGNLKRSARTFQEFSENPSGLAVIGGLHSPPYLAEQDFINSNGLLTLLTWSAAGPITRSKAGMENWFFRLSVDDSRSGGFLVDAAVSEGHCSKIGLLLLDTTWGQANRDPLTRALEAWSMTPAFIEFIPSTIGDARASALAESIARTSPDCLIMLANWDSGAVVINALHHVLPEVRIFSHWGIMGGGFADLVNDEVRTAHQLSVLQTCGLARERAGSAILAAALERAQPNSPQLSAVAAPTGFVHGYDLTRLLIAAAKQAATTSAWQGDIASKRRAIKTALETLRTPVDGILKTYSAPFSAYTPNRPNAHEALGPSDLCLARFSKEGVLKDYN
ncbi:ABC transporter substrate-binding protein [Arenibacterium sp. LLYu02]|uniref:ABC transporter substrate-binding protein n=1 Tax=Arenibacterium sp. LLYu02 TaxID=3404132 RepID=UPI003B21D952